MRTTGQGVATSVFLATSTLVAGVGGRCFEDCHQAGDVSRDLVAPGREHARGDAVLTGP